MPQNVVIINAMAPNNSDSIEETIQEAIEDLEAGHFSLIRAAATAYNISRATLGRRMKGRPSRAIAHEPERRLTPYQEEYLVTWILEQEATGHPPSHSFARDMATQILRANGDTTDLGNKWLRNFIQCHPSIASIIGRPIISSRIDNTHPDILNNFFHRFKTMQLQNNIKHQDIWNMDKTGIALGTCTNSQVIGDSSRKQTYKKMPGNQEWVSFLETISAAETKTRPLVIFKGQAAQTSWFTHEEVPDWIYTTSDRGWTANHVAINWLNELFLPETRRGEQPRMLLLDGHGSHTTVEFQWICKQNNVHVVYIPPHSSHVLQPLDLSCFSAVKSHYRKQISELAILDNAAPVKKRRFVKCYHHAREEGLITRVIRAGWRATGLVPYNPQSVINSSQVLAHSQDQQSLSPQPRKRSRNSTTMEVETPRKPA